MRLHVFIFTFGDLAVATLMPDPCCPEHAIAGETLCLAPNDGSRCTMRDKHGGDHKTHCGAPPGDEFHVVHQWAAVH